MDHKPKAAYILHDRDVAYSPETQTHLASLLDIMPLALTGPETPDRLAELAEAEIILSSWGGPKLDRAFLDATPNLRGVFYAAGSVRGLVTDEFWARDLPICSAWGANAVPVAEFTLAQIILCQKHTFSRSRRMHAGDKTGRTDTAPGNYGTRIGLVGLGMIGRLVVELLKVLRVEVWAFDPVVDPQTAAQLGVHLTDLETLFRECDIISLHAPSLEKTRGMITGAHFRSMKKGASFINTARGAVIREDEMSAALKDRPDLFAALGRDGSRTARARFASSHPAQRFFSRRTSPVRWVGNAGAWGNTCSMKCATFWLANHSAGKSAGKHPSSWPDRQQAGGWAGIRTPGAFQHTRFPGVHNRPLCHPSLLEKRPE